jgi:hypothetical protein
MKKELSIFGLFILIAFIFWGAITLSEDYTSELSVPIKITLPRENLAVEGNIPDFLIIKVRTNGWELLKLKYFQNVVFELNIQAPVENFNFYTSAISNDQLGLSSNARILSIKPDLIRLNFDFVSEKKIKIYPRLNFTLKDGFEIVSPIKLEPDSILIKGSNRVLYRIDSLPTEEVYLNELSEFTSVKTKVVDTLSNLLKYEKVPVNISFDVQQIVDREFEKVAIELINLPKDKDVIILPSFISVKLRGGIKVLGTINPDTLKALVDYKKYAEKEEEIIPEFHLPYAVKLVDYFPKQFKLIIRK